MNRAGQKNSRRHYDPPAAVPVTIINGAAKRGGAIRLAIALGAVAGDDKVLRAKSRRHDARKDFRHFGPRLRGGFGGLFSFDIL